jgi:hypothetical protein
MQFTLRDNGDLRAVSKALRQAANGKDLRRNLTRELRAEIAPMVARVKQAWRSAPSRTARGRRGQSLRRLLANATRGQVRLSGREAGVRIRTDGRKMPPGMRAIPTYAEGTKPRWRHPVYGNRETWATQQPFPGQPFYGSVRPDQQRARREVERAVEQVFKQIVRAK